MPRSNLLQKAVVVLVVLVGMIPVLFFASIEIGIAEPTDPDPRMEQRGAFDRYVDNVAFGVGEKFEFDVNYGFINAGTASLEVARLIEYQGRPSYQLISRAQSNSFFSTFFKVEDRIESIMDAVGLFSWRFEKNLREGNYRADREYVFHQRRNFTVYEGDTIEVEPYVQDALSTMYYVRTQDLKVGESVFLPVFIDGRKLDMEVKVHKTEEITVPAGTFDCLVVEPLTSSVGVFKNEGRLTVWLTNDRLKMPVLMKSKVVVGSISAELTDYTLGEIGDF
jgi:hypothetical protein